MPVDARDVKVRMGPGPGPKFPVGTEIPVIWTISKVRPIQIGASPWRSMRPVDEQEVRLADLLRSARDLHFIVPTFVQTRVAGAISAGIAYFFWMRHFPGEIDRPNPHRKFWPRTHPNLKLLNFNPPPPITKILRILAHCAHFEAHSAPPSPPSSSSTYPHTLHTLQGRVSC